MAQLFHALEAIQRWRHWTNDPCTLRQKEDMDFKQLLMASQRFFPAKHVTHILVLIDGFLVEIGLLGLSQTLGRAKLVVDGIRN